MDQHLLNIAARELDTLAMIFKSPDGSASIASTLPENEHEDIAKWLWILTPGFHRFDRAGLEQGSFNTVPQEDVFDILSRRKLIERVTRH